MPDLMQLDEPTRSQLVVAVDLLRHSLDKFAERYLALSRAHNRAYDVLDDAEITGSALGFMQSVIDELESFRVPDDALRERLEGLALRRAAQGVPLESLARSYQLGSREMLVIMDEVAEQAGLPSDLVLTIHDSTWEFANEAASVFARVQHNVAVERARFDAERRSSFARDILTGAVSDEQIDRDAAMFGLDPQQEYVPIVARAGSPGESDAARRAIAAAVRVAPDRMLFAEVGAHLGGIARTAPDEVPGHLVAVGDPVLLSRFEESFDDAVTALDTAEQFGMQGVVRLADLGPRPLALACRRAAAILSRRHLDPLDRDERSGAETLETTRVYIECDQDVNRAAARLQVHANTVRYRVNRFRDAAGLNIRRTEDLVTAWWLLNGRHTV